MRKKKQQFANEHHLGQSTSSHTHVHAARAQHFMNCVGYQGERSFDFTTGPGANAGFINPENEKIVHSVFTE